MWTIYQHRERVQTFRQTVNLTHLYRNELDKDCFAHGAAYSDSKHFWQREVSQIRFWKIELIKLLEAVNMIDIKNY